MLNSSYGFKLVYTLMRMPVHWVTFPSKVSQSWVEGTRFKYLFLFMYREAGTCRCWQIPWSWTHKQCEPSDVGTWNGTVVSNSLYRFFSSLCSYTNERYFSIATFCLREEAPHIPWLFQPFVTHTSGGQGLWETARIQEDPGRSICVSRETVETKYCHLLCANIPESH